MKAQFSLWFVSLLIWSSFGSAKAVDETVINQFPYVLAKNAPGWILNSARWGNENDYFLISGNSNFNNDVIHSPRIDLPATGALLTVKVTYNVQVYSSEDGVSYIELSSNSSRPNLYSYLLSSKVKYLRFGMASNSHIIRLNLESISDEMHWDVTEDGCTLTGTAVSKETMSYCWFTEVTIPATDYELDRRNFKTKVLFEVSNSDPENTTLYLMKKSPLTKEEIRVMPVTANGRNRCLIEKMFNDNKVSFGIKAVSKGSTAPTIKVERFRVEKNISPYFQSDQSQWYDTDRSENMSFFYGVSENNNNGGNGKYNIKDGVVILDETFSQESALSPCNINNDESLDYLERIYSKSDNPYFNYKIHTNREDKEPLISPLFESRFYYDTNGNYRESFTPCDYNSDGLTDFLLVNDRIAVQCTDGSFMIRRMEVLSQEEYQNQSKDEGWNQNNPSRLLVSTYDDVFLKESDIFVGNTSGTAKTLGQQATDIDFNKDGRPDLLNTTTGRLLLNVAEDKYVSIPLGGNLFFRDLNGDQRMDYIVYEPATKTVTAHVFQADGTEKTQTLISNLSMDQQIWCYDFDKDGDVDILLPFSYQESNGASFLLVMENDGTGKFKKHESYFDKKLKFVACADIDHDGYYDVVAHDVDTPPYIGDQPNEVPFQIHLLKGNAKMQFAWQEKPLFNLQGQGGIRLNNGNIHSDSNYGVQVADINNDGVYEILAHCYFEGADTGNANESDVINEVLYLSGISPNKAPQKPEKPSYLFEPSTGYLKISWQQGKDAESSPVDLTYALRIGTQPGKGDIFYAHATEDGTRLNLLDGNMGYNLDKLLNASNWNAGKYYIAIQSIDPMHKGSVWSDEVVFDKTLLSAGFHLSDGRTVADTLTLTLTAPVSASQTYQWELDGATVIAVNEDKSTYKIQYTAPGQKSISLQTTDTQGNTSDLIDKTFFIFGNRFIEKALSATPEVKGFYGAIDIDNDSIPEVLTNNGIYESNGKGEYTKIKRIYNTNLIFERGTNANIITDINKDGIADIIVTNGGRYNSFQQCINNGDKDMTVELIHGEGVAKDYIVDLNHDGYFDFIDQRSFYINSGNNIDFDRIKTEAAASYISLFPCDMNNDGFTDAIDNYITEGAVIQYLNNGNNTFSKKEIPSALSDGIRINNAIDMNNDGYPDLVIQKNNSTILIALNNKNQDFDEIKEITIPAIPGRTVYKIADFDNNGYPDLFIGTESSHEYATSAIVYFYDDWKYEVHSFDGSKIESGSLAIDLNNDGRPDYFSDNDGHTPLINHATFTNTRPQAPQSLCGVQQSEFVVLKWEAAKDAETPYARMRYNISVKKQGVAGEGAYIISPLNGLDDHAAVVPTYPYHTTTTYAIPISAIPAGIYEVQVQAIDEQNVPSSFSEPFILKVEAAPKIQLPVSVCAELSATVTYSGNTGTGALTWDWDGGTLLAQEGSNYEVVWSTEGTKQLSVTADGTAYAVALVVTPAIQPEFEVHPSALVNAENKLTLPEGDYGYEWEYDKDGDGFRPIIHKTGIQGIVSPVSISRRGNSSEAKIVFKMKGEYTLRLNVFTACGTLTHEKKVSVNDDLQKPDIALVTADAETGRYRIGWEYPKNLPSFVSGINVYKEGNKYNDFRLLATVPVTENTYVDVTSNPQITSSRYRLTLLTSYGAETTPSTPVKGMHTMINKGMGSSWNLIWSQYEGATIESYRILRGTDPDNLTTIGEVSGNATSYSDANAPQGVLYYALEFDAKYDDNWQPMSARLAKAADKATVRSNVASTTTASNAVFPAYILIHPTEEILGLSAEQPVMHLSATIHPLQATFRTVNWTITAGGNLAYINQNGVLTGIGNGKAGTVIARATTIDGSGVYAEISIPVSAFSGVGTEENAIIEPGKWFIYYSAATNELHISGIPEATNGAVICIFNTNGQSVYQKRVFGTQETVPLGSCANSVYVLRIISENGTICQKFIKGR